MRKPMIAGNWKMHKTVSEAVRFIEEVKIRLSSVEEAVEAVVCAPYVHLPALVEASAGTPIRIGAQNMHWEAQGAYTGEVSGAMLADLGVEYAIIGHSERRQWFAEIDESVNRKVHAAYANGLTPIVCVGETLQQRADGATAAVVRAQAEAALRGLTAAQAGAAAVAYEPIWAIGSGKASTSEDASEVIGALRRAVGDLFGRQAAEQVRLLYGGSVKPDNIREFLSQPDIDGVLVGGASLAPDSYIALAEGAIRP